MGEERDHVEITTFRIYINEISRDRKENILSLEVNVIRAKIARDR